MKYLGSFLLLFLVTHLSVVSAQSYINTLNPNEWIIPRNSSTDKLFNFNPYKRYTKNDTLFQMPASNGGMSFYLVFNQANGNQLASVTEGNEAININKEFIVASRPIYTGTSYNKSYFVNYSGPISQLKSDLAKYKISIGNSEFVGSVAEALFIPKVLNKNTRARLDTYFSIKYGISLPYDSDYYTSNGTKIWNHKKKNINRFEVTGIGFDAGFGLKQFKSKNEEDAHEFTINVKEESIKPNESTFEYLLWANNDGKNQFSNLPGSCLEVFEKNWHVDISGSLLLNVPIKVAMKLDMNEFESDSYWLGLSVGFHSKPNLEQLHLIPVSLVNNHIESNYFNLASIKSSEISLFLIRNSKPLLEMTNVECQAGKFNFSITSDNSIKADCLILKGDSLMMKCSPNQFIVDLNSGTYSVELMKNERTVYQMQIYLDKSICQTIDVYPNPVNTGSSINVIYNGELVKNASIQIFSIKGELIKLMGMNEGRNTISLSDFSPGTYIVKTTNGAYVNEQKIAVVDNF